MAETERIPQHRHCYVCGKAHLEDGRFCSNECKENKKAELSRKKRRLWILEIFAVMLMIGAMFLMWD